MVTLNAANERIESAAVQNSRQIVKVFTIIVLVAITGYGVTVIPFGFAEQLAVLIHIVLGLLMLLGLKSLVKHSLQNQAHSIGEMSIAYLALLLFLIATLSGLIALFQAWQGPAISIIWRNAHRLSGWALLIPLLWHAFNQYRLHNLTASSQHSDCSTSELHHILMVALIMLGVSFFIALILFPTAGRIRELTSAKKPNQFKPSLAVTTTQTQIPSAGLADSARCGQAGCHPKIYAEWKAGAHRWSAIDTAFLHVQNIRIYQMGVSSSKFCAGCHDPVALFAGYRSIKGLNSPHQVDGISCAACHSIDRVNPLKKADYQLLPPRHYLGENGSSFGLAINRLLIRCIPEQHDVNYNRPLLKTSEYCAACHVQYPDWKHGSQNGKTCESCHMPAEKSNDPGAINQIGFDHRLLGGNQWMPSLVQVPGWQEEQQLTTRYMQGKLGRYGEPLAIGIGAPAQIKPGAAIPITVTVTNKAVGCGFPNGDIDVTQAWIDLSAKDAAGRSIFQSGAVEASGHLQPQTTIFQALAYDSAGRLIIRHEFWNTHRIPYERTLRAGESDVTQYNIPIPPNVKGPISITARLRYRKANQRFMDAVFPGGHAPITDMASDRIFVPVQSNRTPLTPFRKKVN